MYPERITRGGGVISLTTGDSRRGCLGNFSFSRSVCISVYSAGMRHGTNQVFRERMVINDPQ